MFQLEHEITTINQTLDESKIHVVPPPPPPPNTEEDDQPQETQNRRKGRPKKS